MALQHAVTHDAEVVKMLLKHGVEATSTAPDREAAIMCAGDTSVAKLFLLLDRGAQLEARDPDGDRAIMLATQRGHPESFS